MKRYPFVPVCLVQEDGAALMHATKVLQIFIIAKSGSFFLGGIKPLAALFSRRSSLGFGG